MQDSIYETDMPQTPANHTALSPLSFLARSAHVYPDHIAVIHGKKTYTWAQCYKRCRQLASALQKRGVQPGDTVSFMMETCPEYVWATLAINKLGAIWVPTNVDYKGPWLRESFEDGGAKLLVADAALLPRVAELGALPFDRVLVRGPAAAGAVDVAQAPLEQLARPRRVRARRPARRPRPPTCGASSAKNL